MISYNIFIIINILYNYFEYPRRYHHSMMSDHMLPWEYWPVAYETTDAPSGTINRVSLIAPPISLYSPSMYGTLDRISTPEGDNCGIVKTPATNTDYVFTYNNDGPDSNKITLKRHSDELLSETACKKLKFTIMPNIFENNYPIPNLKRPNEDPLEETIAKKFKPDNALTLFGNNYLTINFNSNVLT